VLFLFLIFFKKPLDFVATKLYNDIVATKKEVSKLLARKEQFKDKPKNTMLRVRVDDETVDKLEEIAKKTDSTKSSVIRKGIDKLYQELNKQK
jgi:hypothetical protein